jgi:hypothetical protein
MLGVTLALAFALRFGSEPPPLPLPSAPSDLSLPSPEALFERHSRAYGLLPVGSIHWFGTLSSGGTQATYEIVADATGRYRQGSTLPLSSHVEGDDGTTYWEQDENGNVVTQPSATHHSAVSRLLRLNDYKFDEAGASVSGIVKVDGRSAYAVRTRVGSTDAVLYIDVATALVDGGDFGSRKVRYHAYKHFEGVPVPTEAVDSDPTTSTITTVDRVIFDAPVTMATFVAPVQREPDMPAGVSEIAVSFASERGLIVLDCKINGQPARMLLDTGSSTSVIDAATVARIGLPTGGIARINAAGELDGSITRADTLAIGGATFHNFVMEAVPLQLPQSLARDHIDGIIGYDVLAQLVARIAYYDLQVRFTLPPAFKYAGTGAVLPLTIANRVPRLDAKLGRGDAATLTVDTGSDAALVLYREFADAHAADFEVMSLGNTEEVGVGISKVLTPDLATPAKTQIESARGAGGGDIPVRIATISRMDLGQFSIVDLFTQVVLRATGAFAPTQSDGIVGAGALSKFRAVFVDYPERRLILEK